MGPAIIFTGDLWVRQLFLPEICGFGLPIKIRNDLSFDESIVIELNFVRKKFFFTVLYRSPAFSHTSPEFKVFLSNFTNLYSKIKNENPYASFFTGDFNGHSQFW